MKAYFFLNNTFYESKNIGARPCLQGRALFALHTEMKQFIRFCIVGVFCTFLDAAIYNVVRLLAPYKVALVVGYVISLMFNYFLTTYWTFQVHPSKNNAVGILLAHLFNLFVVRMGLMFILVELVGIDDQIAYIPVLFISVVINFIIIRYIIKKLH